MTPPSRSLGVLAFALAIQGCGRPGISSLQDRKVLVRSAVGNSFIPGPEMFEVTLDYDVGRCAGALDSGLHATMNGRAIQAVTRGSKPHTSGGLLERRKFPCERPRFSTQLTDADKAAPVTTVEISDGRTTVTAEFVDLYATRTMALVNGTALRPGEPVQLSWTNTDDRFEKLTDETWTGGFSAAPPLLNFRYDGESLRSDVRHEGDPVGWQGEGVTATGSRIAFQVPARAEGGPGVLRARQATGWGLWQEARTCKGADRCLAQPATTSAEARAFVVAPASMRAFSSLANQIESRFNATATLLEDGRVLFAGGVRVGVHLASAEVWDPKTRTWTATSPMHGTRSNHGAIRLPGNRVLVVGGASFDGLGREGAECGRAALRSEIWDAGTGTWSRAGCLPKGFDATTGLSPLALPDGRVVVATESATDQVGTSGRVSFDRTRAMISERLSIDTESTTPTLRLSVRSTAATCQRYTFPMPRARPMPAILSFLWR